MNTEYKNKFPIWVNDEKEDYKLCLTDDIDSLLSCIFLKQIKGYDINYFCDFENIYEYKKADKVIAVDLDLCKGKAWGNHVNVSNNKNCANLNIIEGISSQNYFSKYCGSTLLQILSYYNVDISDYPLEAKMILLAIDSSYKGYYSGYINDNKAHKHYFIDIMGYDCLYDVLENHEAHEFIKIIKKYNLNSKIYVDWEEHLSTDIKLEELSDILNINISLPDTEFKQKRELNNLGKRYYGSIDYDGVFSCALTNRNFIKYSKVC